jgi:hemerythrin
MDDQHGILMDTLNELRLAVVRGSNRDEVNQLMDRLIEFTRMHFWSEEQLMEKFGFPGIAEHRSEHQRLLSQIEGSARKMQHGETVHMRPLLGFLRDGYHEHMAGPDQEYGPWLNARGIF